MKSKSYKFILVFLLLGLDFYCHSQVHWCRVNSGIGLITDEIKPCNDYFYIKRGISLSNDSYSHLYFPNNSNAVIDDGISCYLTRLRYDGYIQKPYVIGNSLEMDTTNGDLYDFAYSNIAGAQIINKYDNNHNLIWTTSYLAVRGLEATKLKVTKDYLMYYGYLTDESGGITEYNIHPLFEEDFFCIKINKNTGEHISYNTLAENSEDFSVFDLDCNESFIEISPFYARTGRYLKFSKTDSILFLFPGHDKYKFVHLKARFNTSDFKYISTSFGGANNPTLLSDISNNGMFYASYSHIDDTLHTFDNNLKIIKSLRLTNYQDELYRESDYFKSCKLLAFRVDKNSNYHYLITFRNKIQLDKNITYFNRDENDFCTLYIAYDKYFNLIAYYPIDLLSDKGSLQFADDNNILISTYFITDYSRGYSDNIRVGNPLKTNDYYWDIDNIDIEKGECISLNILYNFKGNGLKPKAHYDNTASPIISYGSNLTAIYPNPTRDKLYVIGENVQYVTIYSVNGNKVLEREYKTTSAIDISGLSLGTYICEVKTLNGMYRSKLLIN